MFSMLQLNKTAVYKTLLPTAAVVLGALHAYTAAVNFSMNEDGISYLDIGDAYFRGDWEAALSTMWSPLYSWILGLMMRVIQPDMRWEFPLVHIVNFAIFLAALAMFGYLWNQLDHYRKARAAESGNAVIFQDWLWHALGYSLFIICSLHLIEIWSVTPDLLMSAFVYWAAGLLVRIRLEHTDAQTYLVLGVVLGLGYLAKAVMLPAGLLFLAVAYLSNRSAGFRPLLSLLTFILVASPFVAAVSLNRGELSLGSAGAFTYAKHVNGVAFSHWQGNPPENGTPVHPTRQILSSPAIFEFGSPIAGTYPVNFDPGYWNAGMVVHFDWGQQIQALLKSASFYYDVFFRQIAGLVFGLLLLIMIGRRKPEHLQEVFLRFGLALIAAGIFGFYGIVSAEGRYIGAFVVLFFADVMADIRLGGDLARSRLLVNQVGGIMLVTLALNILFFNIGGLLDLNAGQAGGPVNTGVQANRSPGSPLEIAQYLQDAGVAPGTKIGIIGDAFTAFYARLARVRIAAELQVKEAPGFFYGSPGLQSQVIAAFSAASVDVIVSENTPNNVTLPGWQQLGNSNYFIYFTEP